jgi:hypothetical protein
LSYHAPSPPAEHQTQGESSFAFDSRHVTLAFSPSHAAWKQLKSGVVVGSGSATRVGGGSEVGTGYTHDLDDIPRIG